MNEALHIAEDVLHSVVPSHETFRGALGVTRDCSPKAFLHHLDDQLVDFTPTLSPRVLSGVAEKVKEFIGRRRVPEKHTSLFASPIKGGDENLEAGRVPLQEVPAVSELELNSLLSLGEGSDALRSLVLDAASVRRNPDKSTETQQQTPYGVVVLDYQLSSSEIFLFQGSQNRQAIFTNFRDGHSSCLFLS